MSLKAIKSRKLCSSSILYLHMDSFDVFFTSYSWLSNILHAKFYYGSFLDFQFPTVRLALLSFTILIRFTR